MTTEMIHVRVDEQDKAQAVEVLGSMGLSLSTVVKLLLKRVAAEKSVPFDLRVPNAATREAMAEANRMIREGNARFTVSKDMLDALETNGR